MLTSKNHFPAVEWGSVGVLVDGTISKHMWMVQKMVYNILLMFRKGSMISVASFGASVKMVKDIASSLLYRS